MKCLSSEAVQGASLSLERVHNVHGGDGLSLGVLGVGDGIADNVLQEHLQHPAGLLVDQTGDALDAAAARETTNGGFGDSLDVIAQYFTMTLSASFAESFPAFSSSRHTFCFSQTTKTNVGEKAPERCFKSAYRTYLKPVRARNNVV